LQQAPHSIKKQQYVSHIFSLAQPSLMLAINLVEAQPWHVLHPSHGFSKESHYQQATTPRGLLDTGKVDRPFSSMFHHFPLQQITSIPQKGSSLGLAMALPLLGSKLAHTPSG